MSSSVLRLQCLIGCWLAVDALAQPLDLSFSVASATVQRGFALGDGGLDVHLSARYARGSGWHGALGATALHRRYATARWDAQLFGRVGYAHRLDEDWSAQLGWSRYAYPGSRVLRRYANDELTATLALSDRLYVSIAGLRRRHPEPGEQRHSLAYDLVVQQALPSALSAHAGIGSVDTRGAGPNYAYGHLGLDALWGPTRLQLAYVATDDAAKRRYHGAAANRWTASLVWEL